MPAIETHQNVLKKSLPIAGVAEQECGHEF
jgi:hypothetical protein